MAGGKATTGWREVTNRHERDGEHGRTASTSPPFYCERHGQKAECLSVLPLCMRTRVCVCVYDHTRKNEKEERKKRNTVWREGGGRRKGSGGGGGGGAGGGTELSLSASVREKERERAKGGEERERERNREREKERRLAPLTGWPAVERSSCTLIRAPVVAFIYRRLPLSGASAAF